MPNELEVKLELSPDALRRIQTAPWFQALADGVPRRTKIVSVYFDTEKFDLREEGISLRIRSVGSKHLQTIKADAGGGAFVRREWERKVAGATPDLKFAKGTALQPLVDKKLKRALQPIFETDIQRTTIPVRHDDSHVELAIDHGWIRNGRHARPVDEIELELKEGDPAGLIAVAERLMEELPVSLGVSSKAERGYALVEGAPVAAVHAEAVALDPESAAADGFKAIALGCLRHVELNREPVRRGDAEGIHQMRVGLRRLRAALSVFKDMVLDERTADVKASLKWLLEQLGKARDFDVFVKESIIPLPPSEPGVSALKTAIEEKREAGFARAKRAVESENYRRIVLKTALWIAGGAWSTTGDRLVALRRQQPLTTFAETVLTQRTKKIVRRAKKLADIDAHRRHKLRIGVKKLRYAGEFFAVLFPGTAAADRRRSFVAALEELQDALGKLNDITVHEKMADIFIRPASAGDRKAGLDAAFAMGLVVGQEHGDVDPLIETAIKAGKRLKKLHRFWE